MAWNSVIRCRIQDTALDEIRSRCASLEQDYPAQVSDDCFRKLETMSSARSSRNWSERDDPSADVLRSCMEGWAAQQADAADEARAGDKTAGLAADPQCWTDP